MPDARILSRQCFQSTLPHGERFLTSSQRVKHRSFQSTLPHGERLSLKRTTLLLFPFNPRSRTGSDVLIDLGAVVDDRLSIHAPARGAILFIHQETPGISFQSTLPHGERCDSHGTKIDSVFLSIHAPARGAIGMIFVCSLTHDFQSTLPHGERYGGGG